MKKSIPDSAPFCVQTVQTVLQGVGKPRAAKKKKKKEKMNSRLHSADRLCYSKNRKNGRKEKTWDS